MTTNYSFYIPRISTRYSVSQIKPVFSKYLMIGRVRRVDFCIADDDDEFQTAFVHMDFLFDSDFANDIKRIVFDELRSCRVYPDIVDTHTYWKLLKNKNPIPETRLNAHQLAENVQVLSYSLSIALERIDALEMDAREKEKEKEKKKTHRPIGLLLDKLYN